MKTEIDILLAKYFGGNASEKELATIEEWLASSPENQIEFDKMTHLYELLGQSNADVPKPNTAKAKRKFEQYIQASIKKQEAPSKFILFQSQWIFRAASIFIVLLMSSVLIWNLYFSEKELVLMANSSIVEETLPDSTKITLSENSKITYSSNFGIRNKSIFLEGKACFKVVNAGDGKLLVHAGELIIEDIGTIFEVTAYKDSNFICVKVLEGQIHMFTNKDKGIFLEKNSTGYYHKLTKEFEIYEPPIDKLSSGVIRINFQGISLAEAFRIISEAYNVDINAEQEEILNQQITVKFEGENLDMVLQIIAQTLDLKVHKNNSAYVFSSKLDRE